MENIVMFYFQRGRKKYDEKSLKFPAIQHQKDKNVESIKLTELQKS
jgi:hypothetical protein